MQNQQSQNQDENKKTFPRAVYKKGSGRALDDNGKVEAESRIVKNEEELKTLGSEWVETPKDAISTGADAKTGAHAKTGTHYEDEDHKHKKAK